MSSRLSLRREEQLLQCLEAAGLDDDIAVAIVHSGRNALARIFVERARREAERERRKRELESHPSGPPLIRTVSYWHLFREFRVWSEEQGAWLGPEIRMEILVVEDGLVVQSWTTFADQAESLRPTFPGTSIFELMRTVALTEIDAREGIGRGRGMSLRELDEGELLELLVTQLDGDPDPAAFGLLRQLRSDHVRHEAGEIEVEGGLADFFDKYS